jgi:hypothetical protein
VEAVPRFAPRDLLVNPAQFGRARHPEWKTPNPGTLVERSQHALAYLQHQLAFAVEDEIRERGITQRALATEMAMSPGTLGKKLRGQDPLLGEDLFAWILHLDRIDLWPTPANLDELLPADTGPNT